MEPLFLIVLALCVFGPSMRGPLVIFDDQTAINNPETEQWFQRVIGAGWRERLHLLWVQQRPVFQAANVFNYWWAGCFSPERWHLLNALLHGFSACLVWLVVDRLGLGPSLWVAVAFVVHPVQTASVCYVTGRSSILAGLFLFLAVFLYLLPFPACFLAVPCLWLAYLSREDSILAVLWLPILEIFFR